MARARATLSGRGKASAGLEIVTDVLVLGGGPAGAWAALKARRAGCEVVLADKGFMGTSGATAPTNTETWCVPPGKPREIAIARHRQRNGDWCDGAHVERVLEAAYSGLQSLVDWNYEFPRTPEGHPYLGNLRGPDYMRFMRRRVIGAGVRVLDHHPALELLGDDVGVCGAAGIDRQLGKRWQARASAVVLATGGCAFGERFLGATGLTGDGYLMAMEAGATLSGMEMSSQYAVAPIGSSLNKGMPFRWATFYDADGQVLDDAGDDRQSLVAGALAKGPVYASLDKAPPEVREWLRRGQPNCMLPFDRNGIDPFKDRFEVTLRCEGTVRGVGGIKITSADCTTGVDGLFAAGDVATREDLVGALTGGGGPNSSWAIASGSWAGSAAAAHAVRVRQNRDSRFPAALGNAGVRRSGPRRRGVRGGMATGVFGAVQAEMLPVSRNFYRTGQGLRASAARLDEVWNSVHDRLVPGAGAAPTEIVRAREAAAMLAAGRWSLAAAHVRAESRGMHRRLDYPASDTAAPRRLLVSGIDRIAVTPAATGGGVR